MTRFCITLAASAALAFALFTSPAAAQDAFDGYRFAELSTTKGDIVLLLDEQRAPATVDSLIKSMEQGYYDGLIFHHITPAGHPGGAVVQGGAFDEDVRLRPYREGLTGVPSESDNGLLNIRGTIAMARQADPDSAFTQFFINADDNLHLSAPAPGIPGYTVFGVVLEGMDVVDEMNSVETGRAREAKFGIVLRNAPVEPIVIERFALIEAEDLSGDAREAAQAWDDTAAAMPERLEEYRREQQIMQARQVWNREWQAEMRRESMDFRRETFPDENQRLAEVRAEIESVEADEDGVKVLVTDEGDGRAITSEDVILYEFTGWTIGQQEQAFASTVFENFGVSRAAPVERMPGWGRPIEPLAEALVGKKIGSRVLVYVPSGLAYGAAGSPSPPIPPNSDLLMEVKINGVAPTFDEMQDMLEDAETHESGVEFAVLEEGEGTAPTEPEDLVYTSYAGYRDADGIFFDGGFAIFPAGGVIRGWQEMLFEMKPGEARVVRIPSDLAYGPEGRGGIIPPNATLLFYMKLHRFDEFGPRLQRLIKEQIDNQPAQNEGGAAETPADESNADATQQDG